MSARANTFYQRQIYMCYELERFAISSGWQQVNVRVNGLLLRSFLSMQAAKTWCEGAWRSPELMDKRKEKR